MGYRMYKKEELEKIRTAAHDYADVIRGSEDQLMDTLIGACYVTEYKGVKLAVIVVHQDKEGPLFSASC